MKVRKMTSNACKGKLSCDLFACGEYRCVATAESNVCNTCSDGQIWWHVTC